MTPNQPNLARRALLLLSALLLPGSFPLQAANPHDEASPARNLTNPSNPESALRTVPPEEEPLSGTPQRREHLAPRDHAQHTVFANAGYLAILSALYFEESSSGSLNSGFDLMAGYNWTSRRGLGVGIIYSGGFISAERDAVKRTTRPACTTSPRSSSPDSAPAAGGSSARRSASATAVTCAATANVEAAGAEQASTNGPRSNSC